MIFCPLMLRFNVKHLLVFVTFNLTTSIAEVEDANATSPHALWVSIHSATSTHWWFNHHLKTEPTGEVTKSNQKIIHVLLGVCANVGLITLVTADKLVAGTCWINTSRLCMRSLTSDTVFKDLNRYVIRVSHITFEVARGTGECGTSNAVLWDTEFYASDGTLGLRLVYEY